MSYKSMQKKEDLESADWISKKMIEMKKKNEKFMQRHALVEKDRLDAERQRAAVTEGCRRLMHKTAGTSTEINRDKSEDKYSPKNVSKRLQREWDVGKNSDSTDWYQEPLRPPKRGGYSEGFYKTYQGSKERPYKNNTKYSNEREQGSRDFNRKPRNFSASSDNQSGPMQMEANEWNSADLARNKLCRTQNWVQQISATSFVDDRYRSNWKEFNTRRQSYFNDNPHNYEKQLRNTSLNERAHKESRREDIRKKHKNSGTWIKSKTAHAGGTWSDQEDLADESTSWGEIEKNASNSRNRDNKETTASYKSQGHQRTPHEAHHTSNQSSKAKMPKVSSKEKVATEAGKEYEEKEPILVRLKKMAYGENYEIVEGGKQAAIGSSTAVEQEIDSDLEIMFEGRVKCSDNVAKICKGKELKEDDQIPKSQSKSCDSNASAKTIFSKNRQPDVLSISCSFNPSKNSQEIEDAPGALSNDNNSKCSTDSDCVILTEIPTTTDSL